MSKIAVYHGGYIPVEKPEIRPGKNTKDFGPGFYCTVIKEQAQRLAIRYETKIVSVYDIILYDSLKIKEFREISDTSDQFLYG